MKLAHTMIRVKDLPATLDFYENFIGLKEVRRTPIGDEATLVFLTDEEGRYALELTYNHGQSDYELGNQFGHVAFATDDLEEVVRRVEQHGWWYRRSRPELSSSTLPSSNMADVLRLSSTNTSANSPPVCSAAPSARWTRSSESRAVSSFTFLPGRPLVGVVE